MKKIILHFMVLVLLIAFTNCNRNKEFPVLEGEYLGQEPPGDIPELFAPGIVSTGLYERDMAITQDGKEIYFCVSMGNNSLTKIIMTKIINDKWTKPEVAPFSKNSSYNDIEPFISPDGQKFYFASDRPKGKTNAENMEEKEYDIWVMDREGNGWGEPYNFGEPVNSEGNEFFPSLTKDGTIYFTRREKGERADHIFRSRIVDGKYEESEKLGPNVNSGRAEFNAFIAPDESYLLVCVAGRQDAVGSIDYYVTFRDENDNWTEPVNLGEKINTTDWKEYSPFISPDGKYFFFMSTQPNFESLKNSDKTTWTQIQNMLNQPENGNPDIYWVDASFIEKLKQK